jgi:hypothetical protein
MASLSDLKSWPDKSFDMSAVPVAVQLPTYTSNITPTVERPSTRIPRSRSLTDAKSQLPQRPFLRRQQLLQRQLSPLESELFF